MKKRILSILLAAIMVFSLVPVSAFATGTTYAITNGTPESAKETNHGYITVDETAAEGETVTITVKPNEGYQLKSLTVTPAFTVAFDLNGITGTAPEAQTITSGEKATKPADPTDTIHTFAGWYKTKDATTGALSDPWNFDTDTVTADMTLYAKWTTQISKIVGTNTGIPTVADFDWSNPATASIPENAWVTDDGNKAFWVPGDNGGFAMLHTTVIQDQTEIQVFGPDDENTFIKNGDTYVSSDEYGTFTCTMTDGKFTSLTFAGNDLSAAEGPDLTIFNGTYTAPETKKLSEILPSGFPTSNDAAWVNADGKKAYKDGDNIKVGNLTLGKDTTVTKSGDNYVCKSGDATVTFNVKDGAAESITVTGSGDSNGTYTASIDKASYTMKKQDTWFSAFSGKTKEKITDIIFCKELPQDVIAEKPVNLTDDSENGKVKGYIVANGDNYKIYIVGDYIFGNADCQKMFKDFSNLKTLDFGNFDTSNVTLMVNMFAGCSNLTSLNLSSFNTSKVTYMNNMFDGCSNLTSLDLSSFDTSATLGMPSMFTGCSKLESITFGTNFNTSKVTTMLSMFSGCSALESLDLSKFDTSAVTKMSNMFNGCSALKSLDLSKFNTAKVEGMPSMFNGCSALESLDLSKFDTSAVKDMNGMFTGCSKLESITFGTNFNTSKVTAMNAMFSGCSALESLDLSRFDTSAVTNMDAMFKNCAALESLNLSSFGTSAVAKMSNMFNGCSTLERLDISNFTVGNETTVDDMFKDCSKLTSVKISSENEKIAGALGTRWIYNGETKAYEKAVAETYTVTFDLNGITGTAPASEPIKSPSPKLLKSPAPKQLKSPASAAPATITPAKQTDGTYTFTMPGYAVTVTAEFEEIPTPAHTHSFTYTANNGKITATCTAGCDKDYDTTPLTLTLTAPASLVYDGDAKAFTFADGEATAWTGAGLELPTITYAAKSGSSLTSDEAVDAGSYTVSVTVDTDKTASLDFEITKATPHIKTAPAPTEITYGQTLSDSTLAGGYVQVSDTSTTEIGGLFEWKDGTIKPSVSDSETTEYDVTFTPSTEYAKNYSAVTCMVKLTVKKANQTAPAEGTGYTIDYKAETLTATGDTYEISSSNTELAPLQGNEVTPGSTCYVRVKGNDNHEPSAWTPITVSARPAAPTNAPKLVSKTDTTITITAVGGQEYSADGTNWFSGDSDEVTITGLAANTTYSVITRVKAVTTSGSEAFASANSPASVITTKNTAQSTAAADPVDVIGSKIVSGDAVVEVKDENGETVASEDLAAVAEAINEILDNDKVNNFGKTTDETGIDAATDASNSKIVAALKAETMDTKAKEKVTDTDISKYLNVKLVSADVDVNTTGETTVTVNKLVFDVTPMATITVTGSNGDVTLTTEITNDEIGGTVTFLLPVDKNIGAATAAVYHEDEFLGNYPVETDGSNKYIKVTTNSFSEFGYITFDEATAGAKIDSTYYASLSDAVAKVANDQTITLLKNASGTITVSRVVKFTVEVNGNTNNATITAGSGYTVSKSGNTYTVSAYSGGGGGGASSYAVELPANIKNGKVEVSPKNASAGQTVTLTVTPDKGFTLETLTVLDKNGKEIEVKNLGNNKFSFTIPSGKVTISATFMEDNTMLNFCVDVKADDYFYDAVLWAYENEICKGTDYVHFSPYVPVTRAQVVTFLWRAAGCPVVNYAMNMSDVKSGEYYSEAVRWALSEGITKGTSDSTFSPDMVCTRGQIVTFLARFAGVEDADTASAFTDVKTTDYFAAAVKWAKDNKVTEGTSATTFSPNDDCLRCQIVTFLYRYFVK